MSRSPRLTGAELIGALAEGGFQVVRIRGSHHCLRHIDGTQHGRTRPWIGTIGPSLLTRILRDCEMSVDELR